MEGRYTMFFYEIETERLRLKNISYEDREFILSEFSNDSINRYLFDAEPLNSLEEADELISFYLQPEPRMQHRWILILKNSNTKIGTCGFHCWDESKKCVDIGYDLQEEYWGQGLVPEAAQLLIQHCFENLQLTGLWCCHYHGNIQSKRVQEKLGFIYHHTCQDVEVPLMNEIRVGHTNYMTKERWETIAIEKR